jgi:hypothetical protein
MITWTWVVEVALGISRCHLNNMGMNWQCCVDRVITMVSRHLSSQLSSFTEFYLLWKRVWFCLCWEIFIVRRVGDRQHEEQRVNLHSSAVCWHNIPGGSSVSPRNCMRSNSVFPGSSWMREPRDLQNKPWEMMAMEGGSGLKFFKLLLTTVYLWEL